MTQATKTRWQDLILWDGTSEIGATLEYGDEGFEEIVRRYRDMGEIHGYWLADPREYDDNGDDYQSPMDDSLNLANAGPGVDEIEWAGLVDDAVPCPSCGGEAHLLGVLGNLGHYRCRDCGINCSQNV